MKHTLSVFVLVLLLLTSKTYACNTPASVCADKTDGSFSLIENSRPVALVLETGADSAVQRAINSFANDLQLVSGKKASLIKDPARIKKPVIVIGVIGESPLIEGLIDSKKLQLDDIQGQWEAFKTTVVKDPWPNVESALIIAGSDRRGAIFGTYEISEKMGVSPWCWFADAPVEKQKQLYITAGARSDQPKVRYRGLFINDEDPALSGWAKNLFGGVNAGMYERVFELILRLKGNYIWPAMWGKAFHVDDPKNTIIADQMGIVVGTSHHEPMTRAHAEWNPATGGPWNYETNAEKLRKFWRGGIERMMSKGEGEVYESLVTVGMRGDGDEPMSESTAIELLETIVKDQRKIIEDVTQKPANETPQVWALYKEVQDYYDKGMKVPEDITLLFADDNWGQIRRLPTDNLERKGGYGVYYHFDYVGVPRNYKWTNTIQIEKVWQQMNLAYERGARDLWVVNVGDIKPVELPLDLFLTMAWNPEKLTPDALANFSVQWAEEIFGKALAKDIGELVTLYGTYSSMRKPELINETTFAIGQAQGDKLTKGEFYQHQEKWQKLNADMLKVKAKITPEQHSAFFQLVEYPIASLANLYEMYFATAWNRQLAQHYDHRANHFRKRVETAYARDAALVDEYHQLNDGKWDGMMSQVHMNYVIWNDPTQQTMPPVIAVHGGANKIPVEFASTPQNDNSISLEASEYTRAVDGAGLLWTAIPNLGQSKAAMLALPQGKAATTVKDGVRLEYTFNKTSKSDLKISLQLSPTLDTVNMGGNKIGISLDKGPVKTLSFDLHPTGGAINTAGKRAWADAVINNRHEVELKIEGVRKGEHTLKVWRLDDNVVLEKIVLTDI